VHVKSRSGEDWFPTVPASPSLGRRAYSAATAIFRHDFFGTAFDDQRSENRQRHCPNDQGAADLSDGPWPRDLQLFIFGTESGWKCGLSPVTQASDSKYREAVLRIVRELQSAVSLIRPNASQEAPDHKKNPPAVS
jgi:hypothetical protein